MENEYKIEHGVPVPHYRNKNGPTSFLLKLNIGDSVLFNDKRTTQISGYLSWAKKHTTNKYISRAVEGGCRVWKIK